jgi:hypothetical protein
MRRRHAAIFPLMLVVAIATGCGGRAGPPPEPAQEIKPDVVSVADRWDFGRCGHIIVTLETGVDLDIARRGISEEGCPSESPTPFLVGEPDDLTQLVDHGRPWKTADAPIVFVALVGGETYLGAARPWFPSDGCRVVSFQKGEGAFARNGTFVLTTGLVLEVADDFRQPNYPPDPYPLRSGDRMCLDESGRVTSVQIWIPY